MRIVFISNFYNDHVHEFCFSLSRLNNVEFCFIECTKASSDRIINGLVANIPTFVKSFANNSVELLNESDVVVAGNVDYNLIKERVKNKKLTFLCQERALKRGIQLHKYLYRFCKWQKRYSNKDNLYLLCLGKYVYHDYKKFFLFNNKAFKFGYFPIRKHSCVSFDKRKNNFLWCGRMLDWKHPEMMIDVAKYVNKITRGYSFDIVGDGELKKPLMEKVDKYHLNDLVTFHGFIKNDDVFNIMSSSKFYVLSSDSQEGWGASLNEAMSCGMVCFANTKAGSSLYLIKHGYNGFIYKTKKELILIIKDVIDGKYNLDAISKNAFETIQKDWNGEIAANRFYSFVTSGCDKKLYKEGIMSLEKDAD